MASTNPSHLLGQERKVFRMDPRTKLLKGYGRLRVKLKDTAEFLRKGDFVRVQTPGETAGRTELLPFSQQRFTAPECCFSPRTFNSDAREVCRMRDEALMLRRRARRLALIE